MFQSVHKRSSRLGALSALFIGFIVFMACSATSGATGGPGRLSPSPVAQPTITNVKFVLERLHCIDEGGITYIGSAEPYLFTLFFKIDGTTTTLAANGHLAGTATVTSTDGRHNNVGNHDVDSGDTMTLPAAVGTWNAQVKDIPVAAELQPLTKRAFIPGIFGAVVVLLEEDDVSDSGAVAGYQAFVNAVRQEINALIPTLGVTKTEVTDTELRQMTQRTQEKVSSAIQNKQGFLQNLWSLLNKDDTIGSKVWTLQSTPATTQSLRVLWDATGPWYKPSSGIWELTGKVELQKQDPPLPAKASLRASV